MKILIYSDVHISKTSSILPTTCGDSKYSYRQKMIIDTGNYIANLADEYRPDMIINLGDTFDQHTITSYDIDTASEFFKCFRTFNIPHLVLVGNHEMVNSNFNAIQLLSNITNITVISKPCSISANNIMAMYGKEANLYDVKLAFLPYCEYTDILTFPEGDFLFSHLDIQGATIRGNIKMEEGVDSSILKENYKLVFNGHIHKSSLYGNVVNVGSVTTHSFADDNDNVPQCYIFDTETLNLQTFKPKICPLFRKFEINSVDDLNSKIEALDKSYKYILNCSCPFEIKEDVKDYLTTNESVLNHRLSVKVDKSVDREDLDESLIMQQSNLDIVKAFKEFLATVELKYPIESYYKVLDNMEEGDVNYVNEC